MSAISFLLAVSPLLLLVCMLVMHRYPGEAVIERLRRLIDRSARHYLRVSSGSGRFAELIRPVRGGRLIAWSLAGRAPPCSN